MPYVQAIVKQLEDRFPNVDCLDAFSSFDPRKIPGSAEELATYSQKKIDYLQTHYGEGENPDVNEECGRREESVFRITMCTSE